MRGKRMRCIYGEKERAWIMDDQEGGEIIDRKV